MDREPPYFDWSIDRWKLLFILLLFVLLLLGALFWPADLLATIADGQLAGCCGSLSL